MTETFPRGNCESKKMGTKIIKQDICIPIPPVKQQVQLASGSTRARDGKWVIELPVQGQLFMLSPLLAMLILAAKWE